VGPIPFNNPRNTTPSTSIGSPLVALTRSQPLVPHEAKTKGLRSSISRSHAKFRLILLRRSNMIGTVRSGVDPAWYGSYIMTDIPLNCGLSTSCPNLVQCCPMLSYAVFHFLGERICVRVRVPPLEREVNNGTFDWGPHLASTFYPSPLSFSW